MSVGPARSLAIFVAACGLAACGDDATQGEDGTSTSSDASSESSGADTDSPSDGAEPLAPLRRLTRDQYLATVADVLGVDGSDLSLPADGRAGPFISNATTPLSGLHVDQYFGAAETLAARVDIESLSPCPPDGTDECAGRFVDEVGLALWRRPVPDADRERLLTVHEVALAGGDESAALRRLLQALLTSPYFLYHVELGEPDGDGDTLRLSGWEVAARLSYALWNTVPDAELFAAAAAGDLDDAGGAVAQAERMLDDARARERVGEFHLQWLGAAGIDSLDKDTTRYPFWQDPAVRDAMREEVVAFTSFVVLESDGSLRTLLTAPFSFLQGDLFRIYGVAEPEDHDPSRPIALDPSQRSGVLTLPAVLASHSHRDVTSPVHRGLFVIENLLCGTMPPPPPDIDTTPPLPDPEMPRSRRELFELHEEDPVCATCHRLIDPPGLLFEHYDAVGAWRDYDHDFAGEIDTHVEIVGESDVQGPVASVPELGVMLAASADVRRCVARQWLRFVLGREDALEDEPTLARMLEGATDDLMIRDLVLRLVASDSFRRRPSAP